MNKNFIFLGVGLLLAAYFAGRYSAPEKVKIETKTEVKYVERSQETKEQDKTQVTTRITKPNGTVFERTRLATTTRKKKTLSSEGESVERSKTEIENRRGVSVSALAGINPTDLSKGLVWGVSVQKQILGPFILGAWGFTDIRFGISFGVEL